MLLDKGLVITKSSAGLKHRYYKHKLKTFKSVQLNVGVCFKVLSLNLMLSDFCVCSTSDTFRNGSSRLFPLF